MAKRIRKYLSDIEALLLNPPAGTDWDNEIKKHLIQIGFFMHERLIHLIVTVVFAILTVAVILYSIAAPSFGMLALIVTFMILLVPYIQHYYLLENSVQKMYIQYDKMLEYREIQKREE
ncbi:MAG: hypothetical protein PUB67_07005 [Clostridiales bacterium]|nr:hypothetical protein [Clostridiales bacterium]